MCVSSQTAFWNKQKCSHGTFTCHILLGLWWRDRNWDHKLVLLKEHNTETHGCYKRLQRISRILSVRDPHTFFIYYWISSQALFAHLTNVSPAFSKLGMMTLVVSLYFQYFQYFFFLQVEELISFYECLWKGIGLPALIWLLTLIPQYQFKNRCPVH